MTHEAVTLPEELRASVELAYSSGSREAGLSHAASDTDLHVVLKPGVTPGRRTFRTASGPVQITFEDRSRVARVFEESQHFAPTPEGRGPYTWRPEQERTAYRMFHSTPVLVSPDWETRWNGPWRDSIPRIFMGAWALRAARYAEDFEGMCEQPETPGTELLYVAAQSFFTAANVALASLGDVYVSSKFMWRRLTRRRELSALMPTAQCLLYGGHLRHGARARALHALGQYLCARSLLDNWSGELTGSEGAYAVPRLDSSLMSRGFGLIRYVDSWSLAGVPRSYRIDEPAARAWLRLAPTESTDGAPVAPPTQLSRLGLTAPAPLTVDEAALLLAQAEGATKR